MDVETRKRIIKVASELFLKYGLRSVTIDDICNELRISKKTFYVHFKQKEELIESLLTEMRHKKSTVGNSFSPDENAIDIMWRHLNAFKSNDLAEKHINFFYDLQKYYPTIAQNHAQEIEQQYLTRVCASLKAGVEQGVLRSDLNITGLAVLMKNIGFAVTVRELHDTTDMSVLQIIDFMADTFIRVVATEEGQNYFASKRKNAHEKQ